MASVYNDRNIGILGKFLDLVASEQKWGDLDGEMVLDVGCGNPPINLADLLVERYPKLQRVFAIDKVAHLVKYKKPQRQIVHCVADIEKRDDFLLFKNKVSKVLSRHCFHLVRDQAAAFKNIHYILRPGGQAAFLFCLWSGYVAYYTAIAKNSKWNKYFIRHIPRSPVTQSMTNLDAEYYTRLLEEAGFEVEYCKDENTNITYASDQECRDILMRITENSFSVPNEMKDEFKSQLLESFLEHNERDEQGRPSQVSHIITAMVRKPYCRADNPHHGN